MKLSGSVTGIVVLALLIIISGCSDNGKSGNSSSIKEKLSVKEVCFKSEDALDITADLYSNGNSGRPFIILFHQAGWSRGEYRETAPVFNSMGFNCIAVDQRSGREVNGVINETARRAAESSKTMDYLDAYGDMVATLRYIKSEKFATGKLIVLGSSYSSALSFRLAAEFSDDIDGLLCYSPGEYFEKRTGSSTYITEFASKVKCPVYITSAQNEKPYWESIYKVVKTSKTSYLPSTKGNHGSRALWKKFSDNDGYWMSTRGFLKQFTDK